MAEGPEDDSERVHNVSKIKVKHGEIENQALKSPGFAGSEPKYDWSVDNSQTGAEKSQQPTHKRTKKL